MQNLSKHLATRLRRHGTPRVEQNPESTQHPNGGGRDSAVDRWARLDRFLVLGTDGGTYHAGDRALTQADARSVLACLHDDGPRLVRHAVAFSESGRAPSNEPALFVLAMAAGLGDDITRAHALAALPAVARTGTQLFHWLEYVTAFRGWGRGVRNAVARWYTQQSPADLAAQLLKHHARDGWSHRDALRLAHPKAPSVTHDLLFRYAVKGWDGVMELKGTADVEYMERIEAVQAMRGMTPHDAARVIRIYRLTREMVPTELLSHAVVWDALLDRMPLGAVLRHLGVMSKVGLLVEGSDAARCIVARLHDSEAMRRARLHPFAVLAALRTYATGAGGRWTPVAQVVKALESAFYLAFANVTSTGQRTMLALDVSASMDAPVHGLPLLSCREASAAMALVTAATEPEHRLVAFTRSFGRDTDLTRITISPRQPLDEVVRMMSGLPFGGTDCALPMIEALNHRWAVDVFVIYTDNEIWTRSVHPAEALREYREQMGIAAKLVVVGLASNGFSIADPDDAGMLDVVGFDVAAPVILAGFAGEGGGRG